MPRPRPSHCLPLAPLLFPKTPHLPLVRAEAIQIQCFAPLAPGVKHFSFSHFLSCLVRWQGSSLASVPCLQGQGPFLDKVSSATAPSLAFLICRVWPCIGSCDTKGICPTFPSLVLSSVHRQPGQALPLGLAGCRLLPPPAPPWGPGVRALTPVFGGHLPSILPGALPTLPQPGPWACQLRPPTPHRQPKTPQTDS